MDSDGLRDSDDKSSSSISEVEEGWAAFLILSLSDQSLSVAEEETHS